MPEQCKYEKGHFDYAFGSWKPFTCEEDAVEDGLCIFHHPEYWKDHKDEVRKKFMEKVEDAIRNKDSLICIGYNLPKVDLSGKAFKAPVYFKDATFYEDVNLGNTNFSVADFTDTKFLSRAYFIGATFSSRADFTDTKFLSRAYFNDAIFSSKVYFNRTKFSEADFVEAKFFSIAYFIGATFSSATTFNEAKFLEGVLFDYATFLDAVSFVNSDFLPDILEKCLKPYNCISFRHSNFEKQEKVVFDSCNMERVSFICTDVERVKFRNVKWRNFKTYDEKLFLLKETKKERKKFVEDGKRKLKEISKVSNEKILEVLEGKRKASETEEETVKALESRIPDVLKEISQLENKKEKTKDEEGRPNQLLKKCENKINEIKSEVEEAISKKDEEIEENILENVSEDEDLTLDNVLAVYRALRENYDYYLKYDESGKFFINEMKLKKRFSNFIEKFVMSAYELLCLYGESYTRTILWILVTIPLFALARLLFEVSPLVLNMNSLIDSLKISTAAFFQLYYNNDWLTIIERLISISILGSFYIALRRKLERRIRH